MKELNEYIFTAKTHIIGKFENNKKNSPQKHLKPQFQQLLLISFHNVFLLQDYKHLHFFFISLKHEQGIS